MDRVGDVQSPVVVAVRGNVTPEGNRVRIIGEEQAPEDEDNVRDAYPMVGVGIAPG